MASDDGDTDSLLYSHDEGRSWKALKITDKAFQVENIIVEPSSTSREVLVYGWRATDATGVLLYVDFSALHQRTCVGANSAGAPDSDYEK